MFKRQFHSMMVWAMAVLIACFSSSVFAGQVTLDLGFPEDTTDLQSIPGGATTQIVETEIVTRSTSDAVADLTTEIKEEGAEATGLSRLGASAGLSFLWSDHIKVYKLPISFKVWKDFKIGVTFPYVQKTLDAEFSDEELSDSGLGDISSSLKHTWTREKFRLVSTLYVKYPTGNNEQFEDGEERLALGTGSYDFALSESIVVKSNAFKSIRYVGGLSYRYNGGADYSERATISGVDGNFHFEDDRGDVLSGFGGVVWFTPINKLMAYVNVAGMYIWSGKEKYYNDERTIDVDHTLDDSLGAVDIIPGIKYQITKKSAFRLGVVVPVYTAYDPDVDDEESRDFSVDFGIDYVF
jgi:hypothetical protein